MRLIARVLGLPLVYLAFAAPASASSIQLLTTASWSLESQSCSASGTATANCTRDIAYTVLGLPQTAHIVAESTASYGELSLAFNTALMSGMSTSQILTGGATFTDELLLTGGTGSGYVQYVFNGRIDYSTEGLSGPEFQITHDGTTILAYDGPGFASVHTSLAYQSPLLSFVWDDPFAFSASLSQQFHNGSCCSSQQDFFNVGLSEIRVFDQAGNRVTSYSLSSAANAAYATPVPEPGTFVLLGTGLAFGLRRLRNRRKVAHAIHAR